jgi:hypothetical protein
MIWESSYWKEDLLKQAEALRKRTTQRRWPESSFARLEQSVMLGFYSIRKLVEARKLSDHVVSSAIPVTTYQPTGKPITYLNWDHLGELYHLDQASPGSLGLVELCNQFIHSYIFMPEFDENGKLVSIFVASDRARQRQLYCVSLSRISAGFEAVGSDQPAAGVMTYNEKRGDYDVILCNPKQRA